MGALTPVGVDLESSWQAIKSGVSGIRPITTFPVEDYPVRFGGHVPEFDLTAYLPAKEARRMDGFIQHGIVAGIQAVNDSGLEVSTLSLDRVGVAVGSGIGGIKTIETCHDVLLARGPQKVSPFFCPFLHHQYGSRTPVDSLWFSGAKHRCNNRLHHGNA